MPGITSTKTYTPTEILAIDAQKALMLAIMVKAGHTPMNKGDIVGTISANSKAVLAKRTHNTAQISNAVAMFTVSDARAFVDAVGAQISIGSASGTVQSVDLVHNTITLADNVGATIPAGSLVAGADGSQVAKGILSQDVDASAAVNDVMSKIHICGFFTEANLGGTINGSLLSEFKTDLGARSTVGGVLIVPGA